jgi:hypothetical protein
LNDQTELQVGMSPFHFYAWFKAQICFASDQICHLYQDSESSLNPEVEGTFWNEFEIKLSCVYLDFSVRPQKGNCRLLYLMTEPPVLGSAEATIIELHLGHHI